MTDLSDIEFGAPSVPLLAAVTDNGSPTSTTVDLSTFTGLTHEQVLTLEFAAERFLIHDLVPAGAVGTIAGVPETHKSWVAHAIAIRVASGAGQVLGRDVTHQGNVGYWWQDDSTREEAERVQHFETVHQTIPDLPLTWFLNEGLQLPRDIDKLRNTVHALELQLVVVDSFYNVLDPEVELKGDGPELVVSMIKQQVTDPTGCTVLIVDHMPWATDTNRSRLRAYGGVFKNAATRFGIYIDAQGKKLWVEARGNNMRGFQKTVAEWDADQLELKLIQTDDDAVTGSEYEQRILEFLAKHPWSTTTEISDGVTGKAEEIVLARERLYDSKRVIKESSRAVGRSGNSKCWNPAPLQAKHDLPDQGNLWESPGSSHIPDRPPTGDSIAGNIGWEAARPEDAYLEQLYDPEQDPAGGDAE